MKILFLSDYFSTWNIGGATRVLSEQIRALQEERHEVMLISGYPGYADKELQTFPWKKVTYKTIGYLPRLLWYISKQLHEFEPDIVHIHQPLIGFLALLVVPTRVCKVYHFHSYWHDEKVSHARGGWLENCILGIKHRLEQWTLKRMDAFVVLSEHSRQRLEESIHGKPVRVIHGSINTRLWSLERRPAGAYKFLSVRRFDPRMGLDRLILAFREFHAENPQCSLTLVGSGREEHNLKSLVSELKLTGVVKFAGIVSDGELKQHMAQHDCMVIPSHALEGFGMVVTEAFAAGMPVLATQTGGLATFATFPKIFHPIDKPDVENLKNGLGWALMNFGRNPELSLECRRIAREHFDSQIMVKSLLAYYNELLHG